MDLLDPAFIRDPYPTYRRLRETDPVHRMKNGAWLLTRHADIVAALSHPGLGNSPSRHAVLNARNRERYVCADVANNILPFMDKPAHVGARRLIAAAFRAHLSANPIDVASVARDLLRPLFKQGGMDAIGDFGKPLSVQVIARLMGLPASDCGQLTRWSNYFFYLFAPMPSDAIRASTDAALAEFREYFHAITVDRRSKPRGDLVSRLIAAEQDGERLSDAQIVDSCMLLFSDGVENVDAGIANTLLALHRHSDQMRLLRASPELARSAGEEGLRYDSPAQLIARVAQANLQIGQYEVKRDAAVFLALGSANRDEAAFPQPDLFDLTRNASALLSFGKGRHSCIGAPLVRMQMEGALRTLFEDAGAMEVETGALEWTARAGHRWLKKLPIQFR